MLTIYRCTCCLLRLRTDHASCWLLSSVPVTSCKGSPRTLCCLIQQRLMLSSLVRATVAPAAVTTQHIPGNRRHRYSHTVHRCSQASNIQLFVYLRLIIYWNSLPLHSFATFQSSLKPHILLLPITSSHSHASASDSSGLRLLVLYKLFIDTDIDQSHIPSLKY